MTEERSVIDEVASSACERMTCSVNMYIITFSFFTAYATFDLNSPKVYAESFKMSSFDNRLCEFWPFQAQAVC